MNYPQITGRLRETGLLLLSDTRLPSVVGLVAGPQVKGSWWGHKKGREIWQILRRLDSDPDVLPTRLISGKVTYLHRRLWPDFLAVANSREPWQMRGLSPGARRLLAAVTKTGEIRLDRYAEGKDSKPLRKAAGEIEKRLLAYSDEIHTEKGSHAKILATWSRAPKLMGEQLQAGDLASAKRNLEATADGLREKYGGDPSLPWRKMI